MLSRIVLFAALCLPSLPFANAQDKADTSSKSEKAAKADKATNADAKADKAPAKPETVPTAADFPKLYREWKQVVAKLYQLQERYQDENNTAPNKKALEAEFNERLAVAKAMSERLTIAGEKAYKAEPNKNQELTDFLVELLTGYVAVDDYEPGARLGKLLTDNDCQSKEVNFLAGMCFFATNDFDNAEKYLKKAEELKVTNQAALNALKEIPKERELWKKEQEIRAAEAKANDLPRVKLSTNKGDIVVELFENEAPIATANFISLVEKQFYDDKTFHRVIPGFMAQGGDPNGDGSGGPGYTIPCECYNDNHRNHFRGSLCMAKTPERDSAGSQFYLTFVPTGQLDGGYTVFGRIVDGMKVLGRLQRIQPGEKGITPDKIVKATVLSKRKHKYEPLKKLDKK